MILFVLALSLSASAQELTHTQVEIGKPVTWKKVVSDVPADGTLNVYVDKDARDVRVDGRSDITIKEASIWDTFVQSFGSVTGFAVSEAGTEIEFEAKEGDAYTIVYETEAPKVYESQKQKDDKLIKEVTISSDYHYTDILSYTDIPEVEAEQIKLYHKQGGIFFKNKIDITSDESYRVEFMDTNGNGLIDRVKWVTPHLSTQEFEVEITVLNVQSYPLIGGNWTIRFTTAGTADLAISAYMGTTYGETLPDDLWPIELRCDDTPLAPIFNGTHVVYEDFSCDGVAYHTVKVLTGGKHYQELTFGDATAHAQNDAGTVTLSFHHAAGCSGPSTITSSSRANESDSIYILVSYSNDENGAENTIVDITGYVSGCSLASPGNCFGDDTPAASTSSCFLSNFPIPTGLSDSESVTVSVQNSTGSVATTSSTLYINHAPGVAVAITPASPLIGEQITCTGTVTDTDAGDSFTASYLFDVMGSIVDSGSVVCSGTTCTATWTSSGVNDGDTITCNMTAMDSNGLTSPQVASSAATFTTISISPTSASIERMGTQTFTVSGSTATPFTWNLSGTPVNGSAFNPANPTTSSATVQGLEVGSYVVNVTDNNGAWTTATLTVTDTNAPAPATNVVAADTPGDQGDNITITWSISTDDGQGDNDVANYSVLRSTSPTSGFAAVSGALPPGTEIFVDTTVLPDVSYYYRVRTMDISGNFVDSDISGPVNLNGQPIMQEIIYYPLSPSAQDNITFVAFATDTDNETVTMNYTVEVTAFDGGTNYQESGEAWCFFLGHGMSQYGTTYAEPTTECTVTLASSHFTKADKVTITFTPHDGQEAGDPLSLNGFIVINNSRPNASNVFVSPINPNQSSVLSCNYTFTDFDGDMENTSQARFRWYINNEGLNDFVLVPGYTSRTISGIFDKDDIIKCAVQVKDIDSSWLKQPLYASAYATSTEITIKDNAIPQIIDYWISANNTNPAAPGDDIYFNVSWVDYEDPSDQARMYVCDAWEDIENQYDGGTSEIFFGDDTANADQEVRLYTNETGQYVYTLAIKPTKFIENSFTTYSPGSTVTAGDVFVGSALLDFPPYYTYYDADHSDTYTLGESIIWDNQSMGTNKTYNAQYDVVIYGDEVVDGSSLVRFNESNIHTFYDSDSSGTYTTGDDIYLDSGATPNQVDAGDVRVSIVSNRPSAETLSTSFIYDIIVREVDNIGDTTGLVIARDNDNTFTLGKYNYFVPQYNAQPLPGKYLMFTICIDVDNDDTCDSDSDNFNDMVFFKADPAPGAGYQAYNGTGSVHYNPDIRFNYGASESPGCAGATYCSTPNSPLNDISCTYEAVFENSWNNTVNLKVCDEHDACSVNRVANFFVNHIPIISDLTINSSIDGVNIDAVNNFSTSRNLICNYTASDSDPQGNTIGLSSVIWFKKSQSASVFQRAIVPNSTLLANSNTEPGDQWICQITVHDDFDNSLGTNSSPVTILSAQGDELTILSVFDDSSLTAPVLLDEDVTIEVSFLYTGTDDVKVYVCNSSSITSGGCLDHTYAATDFVSDNPINVSWEADAPGTHRYYVKVCDESFRCSAVVGTSTEYNYTVNQRPIVNSTLLTTYTGSTNYTDADPLNCTYIGNDQDSIGTGLNATYTWFLRRSGGAFQKIALPPTTATIAESQTILGDVWICQVDLSDGYHSADALNSSPAFIQSLSTGIIGITDVNDTVGSVVELGDSIDIDVYWQSATGDNAKAFICNSTRVLASGCLDGTIMETSYTSANPISASITPTIGGLQYYYAMVCDTSWNCSYVQSFDSKGNRLNYTANTPPVIGYVTVNTTTDGLTPDGLQNYTVDTHLICNFSISDPDMLSEPSFEIAWYKNGQKVNFPSVTAISKWNTQGGELWSCGVTPIDEYGTYPEMISQSVFITGISNEIVVVENITANYNESNPLLNGQAVTFNLKAMSLNSVSWFAYICNTSNIDVTGCWDDQFATISTATEESTASYTTVYEDHGVIPYYVLICDTTFNCSQVQGVDTALNFTVNHRPVLTYVRLNTTDLTSNFTSDRNLICQLSYNDPYSYNNGYNISYTWYRNGILQAYPSSMDVLSNTQTQTDDEWYCEAQVSDGYHSSDVVAAAFVNISDYAPGSVWITNLTTNSNSSSYLRYPSNVTFNITWNSTEILDVRAFICSNSSIGPSGCLQTTIAQSGYTRSNPIELTYLTTNNESGPTDYYVKLCDTSFNCSGVAGISIPQYYYINQPPIETAVWMNTTDGTDNFTSDRNIICRYTAMDRDDVNASDPLIPEYYWWVGSTDDNMELVETSTSTQVLTNNNYEPGYYVQCGVRTSDGMHFGDGTFSQAQQISTEVVEGIVISNVTHNSPTETPVTEGNVILFSIDWYSSYGLPVRAHICSSPDFNYSGCYNTTLAASGGFSSTNPLIVSMATNGSEPTIQNYWARICDNSYNCSEPFPEAGINLNVSVNHRPNAVNVTVRQFDQYSTTGLLICNYSFNDTDMDPENATLATFLWYTVTNSVKSLIPGQNERFLEDAFSYGDEITCSARVADNHSVSDNQFRDANNTIRFSAIPPKPVLWNMPFAVSAATGNRMIGYFGIPNVNYSVHLRQEFNVTTPVTNTTSTDSRYFGFAFPVYKAANKSAFVIVHRDDLDLFQTGRYISYDNHNRTYFARYRITGNEDLFDDTYKVFTSPALEHNITSSTAIFVYNSTYPSGWFNMSLPSLFVGENTIRIRGLSSYGNGPYLNQTLYLDLENPTINISKIGNYSFSHMSTIYWSVYDNISLKDMLLQVSNSSEIVNYTLYDYNFNDTDTQIVCDGNLTDQDCRVEIYLNNNTLHNLTFTVTDSSGRSTTEVRYDYVVNTSVLPVILVYQGFIDDALDEHIPATIATNTTFTANWTSDAHAITRYYEVKIVEYEGDLLVKDMTNWTEVGKERNWTATVPARNQYIYKFHVRSLYQDLSYSEEFVSEGMFYFVDEAPVCIDCVRFVGTDNGGQTFTNSPDTMKVAWNFTSEAPITRYRYAIGKVKYPSPGYNSHAYSNDYLNDEITIIKTMTEGDQYYAAVRAMNENGIWSPWSITLGNLTVDLTAPQGGSITYPTGLVSTNFSVSYNDGYDDISGIKSRVLYRATAQLINGQCQGLYVYYPVNSTIIPGSGSYTQVIGNGLCYRYKYMVTDYVNNTASYFKGEPYDVKTDTTPPNSFSVVLNNGYYITSSSTFTVDWTDSADAQSGLSHYSYIITEDDKQIGNWTNITVGNTTVTFAQVTLPDPRHQASYRVIVVAHSRNGLTTQVTSNAVAYIDIAPPSPLELLQFENQTNITTDNLVDQVNNNMTNITFRGENGISCVASVYPIDYEMYDVSKTYLTNCSTANDNVTCRFNTTETAYYTRYIVCSDYAGNMQFVDDALNITWKVDFIGPDINMTTSIQGEVLGEMILFNLSITDLTAVDTVIYEIVNATSMSQIFDSGKLTGDEIYSLLWNSTEYFAGQTELLTIIITANDTNGFIQKLFTNFTVDNTRPVINIVSPNLNNRFFNQNFTLDVRVRNPFYNTSLGIYSMNGTKMHSLYNVSNVLRSSYDYAGLVATDSWPDGNYTIRVNASGVSNSMNKSLTIYLDRTAPSHLPIVNPKGPVYNDASVLLWSYWPIEYNFVANTCDIEEVLIQHNATGTMTNYTVGATGYNFSVIIPPSQLDNHEQIAWLVHAKDFSGNWNTTELKTFTVSNRAPYLSLVIPDQDWPVNINNSPVEAAIHLIDPDQDTLTFSIIQLPEKSKIYDELNNPSTISANDGEYDAVTFLVAKNANGTALEKATTNMLGNPTFEEGNMTYLNSWQVVGEPQKNWTLNIEGNYSVIVNRNHYYMQTVPVTPNTEYTLSATMRSVSGTTHGRLHVDWLDSTQQYLGTCLICGLGNTCAFTPELTVTPERKSANMTSPSGAVYARIYVDAQNSSYTVVDDMQFEKSSFATSFVNGSRAATYIEYDISSHYNDSAGTIGFWFRPFWNTSSDEDHLLLQMSADFALYATKEENDYMLRLGDSSTYTEMNITGWNTDDWHYLTITYASTISWLYVDGNLIGSSYSDPNSVTTLYLGKAASDSIYANGIFDDLIFIGKTYNATQVLQLNTSGPVLSSPNINYTMNSSNAVIFYSFDYNWSGSEAAYITADDGYAIAGSNVFGLTVNPLNIAPVIAPIPNQTTWDNQTWSYTINATDADNHPLTYVVNASWIEINESGYMTFNQSPLLRGHYGLKLTVCDNQDEINSCVNQTFNLTILYTDMDSDGISDTFDFITGNETGIVTNIPITMIIVNSSYFDNSTNTTFFLPGSTNISQYYGGLVHITLKNSSHDFVDFDFILNATSILDLGSIVIEVNNANMSAISVSGLILPVNMTKAVHLQKYNTTIMSVCIKDNATTNISAISVNCTAADEILVPCDNQNYSGYFCEDRNTTYRVSGLNHSAVKEQAGCTDKDGDGYFFGSLCISSPLDCQDTDQNRYPGATDICGNGIDEDCSGADKKCSSSSSGGGGGGSRGGSSGFISNKKQCEDGKDNDGDGLIDLQDNGCTKETDDDESDECVENWVCGNWNLCVDGKQTRSCYDTSECNTYYVRPHMLQSCEYTPKVIEKEVTSCTDYSQNYGETDVDCGGDCKACGLGKKCLSNIDCDSGYCDSLTKICSELLTEPVLPTCSDMIQNQGEEDVDCGGPCDSCKTESAFFQWILMFVVVLGLLGIVAGIALAGLESRPRKEEPFTAESLKAAAEDTEGRIFLEYYKGTDKEKILRIGKALGIPKKRVEDILHLSEYALLMLKRGISKDVIESKLLSRGWPKELIELFFIHNFIFNDLMKNKSIIYKKIEDKRAEGKSDELIAIELKEEGWPEDVVTMALLFEEHKDTPKEQPAEDLVADEMSILLELHKGATPASIKSMLAEKGWKPEIIDSLAKLEESIRLPLSRGTEPDEIIRQFTSQGWPMELIEFEILLQDIEIRVLHAMKNNIPVEQLIQSLKKEGYPENMVREVLQAHRDTDLQQPKQDEHIVALEQIFRLLKEGKTAQEISDYAQKKRWPKNIMYQAINTEKYIKEMRSKGNSDESIRFELKKMGWPEDLSEKLLRQV
ncbi:hypothetical protein H6504_02465 [Candidatus Woesearchaeota archaeon]|nr:hypothetical protein [Candidatus Woesearchaeota archaeon]